MNNRRRILTVVAALALALAVALPGTAVGAVDYDPFVTDFPKPAERYVPFVSDFPQAAPAADPEPAPGGVAWDGVPAEGAVLALVASLALVLLAAARRRHAGPRAAGC